MSGDRIGSSLVRLDPESRALLELSVLRGISDDELGGMLGTDAGSVRRRRSDVFDELGATSPLARAAVVRALRTGSEEAAATNENGNGNGAAPSSATHQSAPTTDWEADPDWEPDPNWGVEEPAAPVAPRHVPPRDDPFAAPRARPRRRSALTLPGDRSMRLALLLGLVAAVVVVIVLSSTGGGGSGAPQRSAAAATPPVTSAPIVKGPGSLTPLVGSSGTARARVVGSGSGRQLSLSVRGLPSPQGTYELWLYDSVSDARPLRKVARGSFDVKFALPRAASSYPYLDVSAEPNDGNDNHSGASVLRIRLDRIPGF